LLPGQRVISFSKPGYAGFFFVRSSVQKTEEPEGNLVVMPIFNIIGGNVGIGYFRCPDS
jgi:hypothetical protein